MGRHLGSQGSARNSSVLDSLEIQSHSKCLLLLPPLVLGIEPNYATFRNNFLLFLPGKYSGWLPNLSARSDLLTALQKKNFLLRKLFEIINIT